MFGVVHAVLPLPGWRYVVEDVAHLVLVVNLVDLTDAVVDESHHRFVDGLRFRPRFFIGGRPVGDDEVGVRISAGITEIRTRTSIGH